MTQPGTIHLGTIHSGAIHPEDPKLIVAILAGGAGTRFWPLSTEGCPKQFLKLLGDKTLLQQTYERVAALVSPARTLVLTSGRFVDLVHEQLPEIPAENIIGEPSRRDTAAAVALAALLSRRRYGDGVMAVLTADHHIEPKEVFQGALASAARAAAGNPEALYTFGIRPQYPATAFGYLWRGKRLHRDLDGELDQQSGVEHYQLQGFREKPDLETAQHYLMSGEYYWNSGMFVWSLGAILAELERQLPDHLRRLQPAVAADGTPAFAQALASAFEPLAATSIDFGVMEHARDVRCVVSGFSWNDVGGWQALSQYLQQDRSDNAFRGHLHALDASENIVFADDSDEHVALVGVRDLVVVRAGKRTLVATRQRAEEIKALVKLLPPNQR